MADEPSRRGQRLRHLAKLCFAVICLIASVVYVDPAPLGAALTTLPLWALGASLLTNAAGTIVVPAMISMVAMKIERLSYGFVAMVALNFSTRFYILILPRPVAISVRWVRYRKTGSGDDAAALIAFERVVQLLVLVGAAVVFLAMDRDRLGAAGDALLLASAVCCALLLGLFGMFWSSALLSLARRLVGLLSPITPGAVRRRLDKLFDAVAAFRNLSSGSIAAIMALSVVGYMLFVASAWVIAAAMDLPLDVVAIAWTRSIVFIVTLLPFTIGGIGVREVSNVALLGMYGVDSPSALAFSFGLLAVQLALGAIGGCLEGVRWLRKRNEVSA